MNALRESALKADREKNLLSHHRVKPECVAPGFSVHCCTYQLSCSTPRFVGSETVVEPPVKDLLYERTSLFKTAFFLKPFPLICNNNNDSCNVLIPI